MASKLRAVLRGLIKSRQYCKFTRDVPFGEPEKIDGYPLKMSRDWLLIHNTDDMHLDGFILIRLCDVLLVRHQNKGFQRILEGEGLAEKVDWDINLNMSSTQEIMKGLRTSYDVVILDFDYDEGSDYLYLGEIVKAGKKSLRMRCIFANARWNHKLRKVVYSDISQIRFGDEYSTMFRKYAREAKKRKAKT